MKLSLALVNYAYIGIVILWDPVQRGFLNFDGAGRSVIFLTFMVILMNLAYDRMFLKKYCLSRPIFIWGVWVFYSVLNLIFEGYHGEVSLFLFVMHQLLKPWVVMVLVVKETLRDSIKTLKFLTVIFSIYAVLSITVLSGDGGMGGDRLLGELGNLGPLNSLFIIFFASMLFVHKKISRTLFVCLVGLSFLAIIPAGTRKAFAAAVIILIFLFMSQFRLSLTRILTGLVVLVVLWGGVDYTLKSTNLGDRFEQGIEIGYEKNTTGIKAFNLLGDRATFYINGWNIFKDNLFNGIGLKNYYHKGYGDLVLHSEYMVQLIEGGVLGTLLFLTFHYWIAKGLYRMCLSRSDRDIGLVLLGAYMATLFIGLIAWTYQFSFYFSVFGVIAAYIRIHQSNRRFSRSGKHYVSDK